MNRSKRTNLHLKEVRKVQLLHGLAQEWRRPLLCWPWQWRSGTWRSFTEFHNGNDQVFPLDAFALLLVFIFLQDRFYGVHPHSSTKIPGFSIPLQGLEHNHGAILDGGTGGVWKCLHGSRVLKVFKWVSKLCACPLSGQEILQTRGCWCLCGILWLRRILVTRWIAIDFFLLTWGLDAKPWQTV